MSRHFKMHHAPHQERLDLYRYCLAADTWSQARVALQQIQSLEHEDTENAKMTAYLLRVAFYTLYGRPFKQRLALRIDAEIVPTTLVPVHNGLITLRDKMFAHSDKELVSSVGDPINTVLVEVKPRSIAFGINTLRPLKKSIETYLNLLDRIIKTAVYRRDKTWRRWHRHLDLPMGSRWVVNFGTESNEILKQSTKEPRVFSHSVGKTIMPL
jgi:hypothetical protein